MTNPTILSTNTTSGIRRGSLDFCMQGPLMTYMNMTYFCTIIDTNNRYYYNHPTFSH
jgi:hypothetical protein